MKITKTETEYKQWLIDLKKRNVEIFTKCKSTKEAIFYVEKTIKNGWSRSVLMNFLEADLYSAQGKSPNNFSRLLPEVQSDLAREII